MALKEESRPGPNDPEWSAWATLCNDLTEGLRDAGHYPILFSGRTRLAEHMWAAGYRPTPEAIEHARARQSKET